MKPLVLCADDYAVHEAASRGIVHLAQRGRLSATSVMSLSPRWAADAPALRAVAGQIDVGLHLDWTSPFALAAGHGRPLGQLMLRSVLAGIPSGEARDAIERQLDAFELHWGAAPDHIDGHQHVQQFDGIRQALVQVIRSRYAGKGPYLRLSQAPAGQRSLKGFIIAAMGAKGLQALATQAGLACSPSLSGIYDFDGDRPAYRRRMQGWLRQARGGIIMCHPATQVQVEDSIAAARQREFGYLDSSEFADDLHQAQVRLVRGPG
jgi:predicted glycoside hydrolase/deacetylase ChbG (UPF0249 family)